MPYEAMSAETVNIRGHEDDMIDAYISLKMEEVTLFRMTTHPIEFQMYYSL